MKKLRRLLFRLLILALLITVGIIAFNTFKFSSKQLQVAPVEKIGIGPESIERMAEAIRIPTLSYDDRVDTAAFLAFNAYLDSTYALVDSLLEHKTVGQFSHVYRWPGRRPGLKPILLIGHIDVVPVEGKSLEEWSVRPYSGLIRDDYLWGRGTLDDKINVIGALEAVKLLLTEGYQPERSIYLAFGHDEEVGGKHGAQAIAQWFKQQGLEFEYVLDEGMLIIKDAMPGLDRPLAMIGAAEKGYTTLTLQVKLEDGGHSSMPLGESAIGILSKAVATLEAQPFPAKIEGLAADLFDHCGPEMSMPHKAVFANLWLFESLVLQQLTASPGSNAMVRTTTAPTILEAGVKDNILPTSANAKINFRILPGETVESVTEYVRQTIDDERVKVMSDLNFSSNPSKISGTETFGFSVIRKTAQEIFPEVITAPSLVIAATDSRHYGEVAASIYRFQPLRLLQADLKRIHGIDERISLDNYRNAVRFYRQLMLNSSK
ncbi:MAG: M20 family peptidase [Bacteroidota bacterium]